MLNYQKVSDLYKSLNGDEKEFFLKIDMTYDGFIKMIKNKRMKVETLEKISVYFNRPLSWFFDEMPGTVDNFAAEPESEYGFKEKYYDLLEKYTQALEKINILNNEKDKSTKKANPNIYNT